MRLGLSANPPHSSPSEWIDKVVAAGLRAVVFPCDETAPDAVIDEYVRLCRAHDVVIAEVGAWSNPLSADQAVAARARALCKRRLALADYVGARCCVNIAGAAGGAQWDGPASENYGEEAMRRVVDSIHEIIDDVNPRQTCYTLEPMPWMVPDSPEQYREVLDRVGDARFAVHMDIVNMISSPRRYFFNREFMERAFALLAGRIRSCHLKDIRIGGALTLHLDEVPCGEGGLDIRRYAELATAEDPDMPLIIEHLSGWEAYAASLSRVRDLLAHASLLGKD